MFRDVPRHGAVRQASGFHWRSKYRHRQCRWCSPTRCSSSSVNDPMAVNGAPCYGHAYKLSGDADGQPKRLVPRGGRRLNYTRLPSPSRMTSFSISISACSSTTVVGLPQFRNVCGACCRPSMARRIPCTSARQGVVANSTHLGPRPRHDCPPVQDVPSSTGPCAHQQYLAAVPSAFVMVVAIKTHVLLTPNRLRFSHPVPNGMMPSAQIHRIPNNQRISHLPGSVSAVRWKCISVCQTESPDFAGEFTSCLRRRLCV